MAEEEKTELPEITEEKIEKAALPENKRVDEEISEEATFVELDEADVKELGPVTDEEVKEDFEPHEMVEERVKDSSEVEKRAALARRIVSTKRSNKAKNMRVANCRHCNTPKNSKPKTSS